MRDYQTGRWAGGDPGCDHLKVQDRERAVATSTLGGGKKTTGHLQEGYKDLCGRCGARRVDQQLGLEDTPDAYVARMVEVFREVRRVLHDQGTCWLNLGDSYASDIKGTGGANPRVGGGKRTILEGQHYGARRCNHGLKPKDLIGIPWRVALALQADGWYLRSDIIWHKPNPMPESVTDRPTKSHEYLFLLTKSASYYYDADAVREPHARLWDARNGGNLGSGAHKKNGRMVSEDRAYPQPNPLGRNRRTVWTICPKPYKGAHFATFPPALVEPCILAGTSAYGHCASCGAGWVRETVRRGESAAPRADASVYTGQAYGAPQSAPRGPKRNFGEAHHETTGWRPSCSCNSGVLPGTVLDPFVGSGTTLMVAAQHGRNAIGIDLSAEYLDLARQRLAPWMDVAKAA